jgi:hypothetical protein
MYSLHEQHLKLYRNFKSLRVNDFHGIVRYYEEYEADIRLLDFEEYFDCTYAYATALFETAEYKKHIVACDQLLELIIMENVDTWAGEDVYTQVLLKKAASLHQLREDTQAEHVLRELLKICPDHRLARHTLQVNLLRRRPRWLLQTRAIALAALLLSALAIAAALFVVEPFFPQHSVAARWAYNALLVGGALLLAAWEFAHYWRCRRDVRVFVKKTQKRRRGYA